jgi:hypothetical protein
MDLRLLDLDPVAVNACVRSAGGERRRLAAMRHGIELEGSVSCTLYTGK